MPLKPAVWFPAVKTNTGTDVFTEVLAKGLNDRGIKARITWLPLRAEYAPWSVPVPKPPEWASVVHVNTWLHPRFIPKNLPIVATIHHSIHHPEVSSYKGWLKRLYHEKIIAPRERRVMQSAQKVIGVSQFVADTAQSTLLNIPIQVIHNGVDINVFSPGNRARQINEPFRLLYVGNWKKLKGVDLLPAIMKDLGNDYELLYTGGPQSDEDKPNMPENMIDIGRLEGKHEVAKAMKNTDALLFPSRSEGHPLVALEAMACGLPIFAMEGSSISEAIKYSSNSFLCKRDNPEDFSQKIRKFHEELTIPQEEKQDIKPHLSQIFSEKRMLDEYIMNCYEKL